MSEKFLGKAFSKLPEKRNAGIASYKDQLRAQDVGVVRAEEEVLAGLEFLLGHKEPADKESAVQGEKARPPVSKTKETRAQRRDAQAKGDIAKRLSAVREVLASQDKK